MTNTQTDRRQGATLIELLGTVASVGVLTGVFTIGYKGVQALNKYLRTEPIQIENKDMIGGTERERFVRVGNEIFYSRVDGKSIEDNYKQ